MMAFRSSLMFALTVVTVLSSGPAHASPSARTWYGTYTYTELIKQLSGITASIDYRVTLSDRGCGLDAEGLQTDTHIRCTARLVGANTLQIGFKSYADGGLRNQSGVALYKVGGPMLRFERTPRGLLTRWQGFTLSDGRVRVGRTFRKSN